MSAVVTVRSTRRLGGVIVGACLLLLGCGVRPHEQQLAAMSTIVRVTVYARQAPAWDVLERQLSGFARLYDHRDGGLLADLNAAGRASVGERVAATLTTALDVAARTDGAFDPTILPLTELWQFDAGGVLPDAAALAAAAELVDWRRLRIYAGEARLAAGARLDLGAIAKGAVVDHLADWLEQQGHANYLVEAGGDIILAGSKPDASAWRIWLRHPRQGEAPLTILSIPAQPQRTSVVTSGDYERVTTIDGVAYHHILDPRSGRPAAPMVSVTVVGSSATESDALATALFVLGPERAQAVAAVAGVEVLMVWPEESTAALQFWSSAGFPAFSDAVNLN